MRKERESTHILAVPEGDVYEAGTDGHVDSKVVNLQGRRAVRSAQKWQRFTVGRTTVEPLCHGWP